jgi:hypothetical protein
MIAIQNDTVDVLSRELNPYVIRITNSMLEELTEEQRKGTVIALHELSHWHGE